MPPLSGLRVIALSRVLRRPLRRADPRRPFVAPEDGAGHKL